MDDDRLRSVMDRRSVMGAIWIFALIPIDAILGLGSQVPEHNQRFPHKQSHEEKSPMISPTRE